MCKTNFPCRQVADQSTKRVVVLDDFKRLSPNFIHHHQLNYSCLILYKKNFFFLYQLYILFILKFNKYEFK